MASSNTQLRYGTVAITFHWIIAALILVNIGLGLYFADMPRSDPNKFELMQFHKSIGLTVLTLSVLRVLWRVVNPVPAADAIEPRQWEAWLKEATAKTDTSVGRDVTPAVLASLYASAGGFEFDREWLASGIAVLLAEAGVSHHGITNWWPSGRIVRTGQGAVRTTLSATLPMSTWASPERPCVARTIRSTACARA